MEGEGQKPFKYLLEEGSESHLWTGMCLSVSTLSEVLALKNVTELICVNVADLMKNKRRLQVEDRPHSSLPDLPFDKVLIVHLVHLRHGDHDCLEAISAELV